VAIASSRMQRCVAINIAMFCIPFVLIDKILYNLKMAVLTSTMKWSATIIVRALWTTVVL